MAKRSRQWTTADEGALNGRSKGTGRAISSPPRRATAISCGVTPSTRRAGHARRLLLQTGDGASASRVLKAAIDAGARDAGVFNNYALALTTQGKQAAAITALEKSVALKPDSP